jgi:hypothetical protein
MAAACYCDGNAKDHCWYIDDSMYATTFIEKSFSLSSCIKSAYFCQGEPRCRDDRLSFIY